MNTNGSGYESASGFVCALGTCTGNAIVFGNLGTAFIGTAFIGGGAFFGAV